MDAAKALHSIETAIRLIILQVYGSAWLSKPGAPSIDDLEQRRVEEDKRRNGVVVSSELLDYSMLFTMSAMILRNWEDFKVVFDDKKRTEVYFGVVEDVRNALAHSRPLVTFEERLLAGVEGHIRAMVTEYRSANGSGSDQYYPRIERIADNMGNIADPSSSIYPPVGRLEVGDIITFKGSAYDSRGDDVLWYINALAGSAPPRRIEVTDSSAAGHDVEFSYEVQDRDVSERLLIAISIATSRSYHRYRDGAPSYPGILEYDDVRYINYSVNPPLD